MSRIQIPAEKFRNRNEALQSLMAAGERFNDLLLRPARMAQERAARSEQPSYIESLRTGRKADCAL